MTDPETIAVWFSCGVVSAAAAKITVQRYGNSHHVRVLNTPIAEEDEDNRRFLRDVEVWIDRPIETVIARDWPASSAVEVWEARKAMSFPHGAPCTVHLKKEARQQWEAANHVDWHVLGYAADEKHRHDRFILTERSNVLPILIDARMSKAECGRFVQAAGIGLPRTYAEGYPNANCIGCVKATSPTYWNLVRRTRPEVFRERAEQSRSIGARLVRVDNERIFLDELDELEEGRPLEAFDFECGLFCEEMKDRAYD